MERSKPESSKKKTKITALKSHSTIHEPNESDRYLVYGYIRKAYNTGNIPKVIMDLCIKMFCDNDNWDSINMIEYLKHSYNIKNKTVFNYYCERYNLFGMDKIKRNETKTWRIQIIGHDGSKPWIGIVSANFNEGYFDFHAPNFYYIRTLKWDENEIVKMHLNMIEGKVTFYKDENVIDSKSDVDLEQEYKLVLGLDYGVTVKLLQ